MQIGLIAGTHSGCGKTTLSLALAQRLIEAGKSIFPFKAGPDFLDPFWHQQNCGQPCYNLDTKMMTVAQVRRTLSQVPMKGLALIEGVMGLFDGASGVGGPGSSLDLAETLGAPVFLVVNVKGMSGSLAPLVAGFQQSANRLGVQIVGLLVNQVGSDSHLALLREILSSEGLPPILGALKKGAPSIDERHLGLTQPSPTDFPDFSLYFDLDLPGFEQALAPFEAPPPDPEPQPKLEGKKIAVAQDEACCFVYQANLDWLQNQGADVAPFSPLAGEPLPKQADALWLPGGYPEVYAKELSDSTSWGSINRFIETGGPCLAECGGLMLLGQRLTDLQGVSWPMSKLLPYQIKMETRLVSLGYREEAQGPKGHEFHHSKRQSDSTLDEAFNLTKGDRGVRYKNLRASYVHWYFPSCSPVVARWFGGA